jgi:hypothetical protein
MHARIIHSGLRISGSVNGERRILLGALEKREGGGVLRQTAVTVVFPFPKGMAFATCTTSTLELQQIKSRSVSRI